MKRRQFLTSSLSASAAALAVSHPASAQSQDSAAKREYYELRRYHLVSGPQQQLLSGFLAEALIPAATRLGIGPVGVFDLYLGPETPSVYVLLPCMSLDTLVTAELRLAQDEEYQRAGQAFLKAPANQPPYDRLESSLLIAFEGHPKLTLPPTTAQHAARVFQMRTYESPSNSDHRIKVEMFNSGEFAIFEKAGFSGVFYGDTLVGPRLPNLKYMLSFPDLSELDAKWKVFSSDPDWKKLSGSPKFNFEPIVSNIDNLILRPTSYSQI